MADAGRVIAGTARDLRLRAPGPVTRPLADRVKETLFAILEPDLDGASFLDLFAGSGAGGIEALSRGAASATFVERDQAALRTIERNLASARVAERAAVVGRSVESFLAGRDQPGRPFDVVLVDPPYRDTALLQAALKALAAPEAGLLARDARVVAKHFWREAPPAEIGLLRSERERRFGETALTFYRAARPAGEGPA